MVRESPDLSITQTDEPAGRWCSSGHIPPPTFTIGDISGPTRFFRIEGRGISGVFCELCLTIANQIAREKKEKVGK